MSSETAWILFLASSELDAEQRFIKDLAYGVFCLEAAGISHSNIFIYIDGQDRNVIRQIISTGTNNLYNIKITDEFFIDMKSITHKNVVMFVTGHGNLKGIDASPEISPTKLVNSLKTSPNFECGIIYLGQCYAGVFNYINVKTEEPKSDIIMVGATNLHSSISSPTQKSMLNSVRIPWVANLFLLNIFEWFGSPHDLDGDGYNSIVDSYKYAGGMTHKYINEIKGDCHQRLKRIEQTIDSLEIVSNDTTLTVAKEIIETKKEKELMLQILYNHQESWILNAIPGQNIII